ncbi:putative O-glycosylation ligase, exosortase A system-associated [Rhodoferax fermentans]|uniref:Putative O-glycosylation ligase, exosortase A system-associated n=1 Tax=Rhodoferax fermentans TaxID=28066 RepID=A0A1T1AYL4_RHOFE|nr:putative O-glycosylation ligase, exosortase A system-associated [Rhodoferax fermentans]OOV09083.1 putative O-glycosylation ligase, exosortase A system-associated [Rhodoferax fermentans]
MRDLMFFGFMLFLVQLSFRSTFNSYLLWGWTGLISINSYLYGFMNSIPYVQVFAVMTLFLLIIKKDVYSRKWSANTTAILFIVFGLQVLLSATFAYPDLSRNWELCTNLLKTLLFCLIMPMLLTTRTRIHAFVLMIILGSAFHGVLNGLKFIASAGGHLGYGPAKLGDNNHFAMVMAMTVPLVFYAYLQIPYRWVRVGALVAVVLTILTVISTRSRGGLIALVAMGLWMLKVSQRKFVGALALISLAFLVVTVAPDSWSERMGTISEADQDSSFMTRVAVWKKSTAIALENPLLGGGLDAVAAHSLYEKFRDAQGLMGFIVTPNPYSFVAHSIYFQVMGDLGFLGFFLFLLTLLNSFKTRNDIKKIASKHQEEFKWAVDLADLLTASMIAYAVGGALLSAAYFELPYMVIMLMECIKQQIQHEIRHAAKSA